MDARSSSGGAPRGGSGSPSKPLALPRVERLRSAGEFQAVFERGKRLERPAFVALWSPTPGKQQTGFTVSRQIRGAVKRNRARRRLREAYRSRGVSNPTDISIILIGRPPVLTIQFDGLVRAVDDVLRQLGRAVGR